MPLLFLVRAKFFNRPMRVTSLTKLLSKIVCPETKGEGEAKIKRNDLNCH